MDRIRFHRSAPAGAHSPHRLGQVSAVAVMTGLALVIIGSLVFGVAVRAGIAPAFD